MDSNVYIGSIPFDQTEEQVMEIAKSIGPVVDMKLLFDPMTGKSRGYAFVKYIDHETAASAVRNLNNLPIGNRNLKCSYAAENSMESELGVVGSAQGSGSGAGSASGAGSGSSSSLPILPPGMSLFPNQTAPQAVSAVLSTLDQSQFLQLLIEAKKMCQTNPQLAQSLFEQSPQLAHALVESSLILHLTTPDIIQLCLNKPEIELEQLTPDHEQLLQSVSRLTEQELKVLSPEKREIVLKIKKEIEKGSYGTIPNTAGGS
ncbi:mRNA 3'-end-processing protein Rna15p [[Candida] railenensis]|uniref:mRNA 3'-end-processing protein Rna15p n=1 Tax=[Candida] railenensis TaxID=45579 RepID=A0A9P0W0C0_9ASCO|nr:mRNA 3'-end-processing protein Rna15p [[Candida] railenensis]